MKKNTTSSTHQPRNTFATLILGMALVLAPISLVAEGNGVGNLLDDFSDVQNNSLGIPRMIIDDTTAGGKSTSTQTVADGVLSSAGDLAPPRGQPGWVSLILLLGENGTPVDISQYEGVRMNIHVTKGMLSLSVNSTDVQNFDYHAAMIEAGGKGFKEVKIPFKSLRRAWSEQTKLNAESVASVSLVAVGLQPGSFAFEIDEIGFY